MLTRRQAILVKEEVTYNTDPVPTAAANGVFVESPAWSHDKLQMIDRPGIHSTLGTAQSIYGGRMETVSFSCELKGSGTAGTAPEYGVLLQCCGMAETLVALTSATYAPASNNIKSCTIYYYQDGKLHKLTGCRGEYDISLETGKKGMINFKMTGHIGAIIDSAIVTPTIDPTKPVALVGIPFTVGAYSAIINSLKFAMGNSLATPPDISAADGFGEVRVGSRKVAGSFDPEDTLVATHDWVGIFEAGTTGALSTGAIGSVGGNIVQIDMPAVYYMDLAQANREGVATLNVPFGAAFVSGDDEVSIAFT